MHPFGHFLYERVGLRERQEEKQMGRNKVELESVEVVLNRLAMELN